MEGIYETGPTYGPYPKGLERLTICEYNYKGSCFKNPTGVLSHRCVVSFSYSLYEYHLRVLVFFLLIDSFPVFVLPTKREVTVNQITLID